jgi:predicted Zn-dependent peptidase
MYEDKPDWTTGELFETLLYLDQPLGRSLGTKETVVASYTARHSLVSENHYICKQRSTHGCRASKKTDQLLKTIEEEFGKWGSGHIPPFEKVIEVRKHPKQFSNTKKSSRHFLARIQSILIR